METLYHPLGPYTSLLQHHLSPSFLSWSLPPVEVTSFVSLHSFIDWKFCNSLSTQPPSPHPVTFQSSSVLFFHNFLNSSAVSFLIFPMYCGIDLHWLSFYSRVLWFLNFLDVVLILHFICCFNVLSAPFLGPGLILLRFSFICLLPHD